MKTKVAAIQCRLSKNTKENVDKISDYVHKAAQAGAQIILPSELFESHYFCKTEKDEHFSLAHEFLSHPTLSHFQKLAEKLKVCIPVSFFEKDKQHYFNSLAMYNEEGRCLGVYRKSHIPDGPGYEEKFYFKPGNTGFKVWPTRYGQIGVGICWDQWFPECARAMVLQGADLLLYPTAIGSEPEDPTLNTKDLWQRAMIGHAVSNVVPVVAANRIGDEEGQVFYGHSFASDHRGNMVQELGSNDEGLVFAEYDFSEIRKNRASFGFFRDRRPDLYKIITD